MTDPNARLIKKHAKLKDLARKAWEARDRFDEALTKAQSAKDWTAMCDLLDLAPDSNASDWMC